MSAVALIHLDGTRALPSAKVLASLGTVQEFQVGVNPGESRISRSAVIATGVRTGVHGVDSGQALDTNPFRVRPRESGDCKVPWVWDVAHDAGLRAAVIGWPGITVARGSRVPMVTGRALAWEPPSNEQPPLAGPFVEPEHLRESIAQGCVAPSALRADELPSEFGVDPDVAAKNETSNAIAAAICRARSALGALDVLNQNGIDFISLALHVPEVNEEEIGLGAFVLDLLLPRVREMLGPESIILAIATRGHLGRCVLAAPAAPDGASDRMRAIDVAPTVLGLLGIDHHGSMEGKDVMRAAGDDAASFVVPAVTHDDAPEFDALVEAIEANDLADIPEDHRESLRRFAVHALARKWIQARLRRDFKTARSSARLLVRLDANVANLWRLAFSCFHCADAEGVQDASRRLLAEYPGSPAAMLSAILTTHGAPPNQLRAIVEAIDPATLAFPSMRAMWARSALKAGLIDQGIDVLAMLVDSGLNLPADRIALVTALHHRGELERALAVLGPLGSRPEAPLNMRLLRAKVLLGVGRVDEAHAVASAVLEAYPHEQRAAAILAQAAIDPKKT